MRPKNFDIQELIDYLQGTCMSLYEACQDFGLDGEDDLTHGELDEIDNNIFLCDVCDWWCEISEETESKDFERVCTDCNEEE